jgi:DNA methylase
MKDVPQDLIDYLLTMISPPPHIPDVQIPIVLDVAGHDFTQYADASLHGVIARGTPTMEQSAEIMRACKPGAHVMLMTNEDDLTGHVGTCNLEDNGMEIRDSLVVLEEDIPFFYGAKAATRERNAGTHELMAEPQWGLKSEYIPSEEGDTPDEAVDLAERLTVAGISPEVVDHLFDSGTIAQSKMPGALRKFFVEKKGQGRGNLHPCLHPDALVMTDKGYVPIKQVAVGDKVYSADGRFHTVEHVSAHPYTSPDLFEIAVQGLGSTLASDNHPFLIWREDGLKARWVEAKDIQFGDLTMTPRPADKGEVPFLNTNYNEHAIRFRGVFEGVSFQFFRISSVTPVPYVGDVWNLSVEGSPTFQTVVGMSHNTVKPADVLEWLLKDLPSDSKTVLDCFMGSGSMGIAAIKTGHNYIGIEMDPEYIKIADARIRHWATVENGWVKREIVSDVEPEAKEIKEMTLDDLFGWSSPLPASPWLGPLLRPSCPPLVGQGLSASTPAASARTGEPSAADVPRCPTRRVGRT